MKLDNIGVNEATSLKLSQDTPKDIHKRLCCLVVVVVIDKC